MILSLPAPIQKRLDHTLAQWRHWACEPNLQKAPAAVRVLDHGLSNYSVLVSAAGRDFVVRIDGINPISHGLNRQLEWRALKEATRAGIAPCPRYFNPELGSLVCDYLPPDNNQESDFTEIAKLLQSIHTLPPRRHRLDLKERIARYKNQLIHRTDNFTLRLLLQHEAVAHLIAAAKAPTQENVLCHNDLLRANRLRSANQLYALDWEYCTMGSPWYDIAVVCIGDELTNVDKNALVIAYLGRDPNAAETSTLARYACIYQYLELLWYLVQEPKSLTEAALDTRLKRLEQNLVPFAAP